MCFYSRHMKFYVVKIPWYHFFAFFYSRRASIREFTVCKEVTLVKGCYYSRNIKSRYPQRWNRSEDKLKSSERVTYKWSWEHKNLKSHKYYSYYLEENVLIWHFKVILSIKKSQNCKFKFSWTQVISTESQTNGSEDRF